MPVISNKESDKLIEIRKSFHQEYIINYRMVINGISDNENGTVVNKNTNKNKINENVCNKDISTAETKSRQNMSSYSRFYFGTR